MARSLSHRLGRRAAAALTVVALGVAATPAPVAVLALRPPAAHARVTGGNSGGGGSGGIEQAASRAASTTRHVVGQFIAIALGIAAVVLIFKRDFAEAAGVFAIGMIALLLANPAGINVMKHTITSIFP